MITYKIKNFIKNITGREVEVDIVLEQDLTTYLHIRFYKPHIVIKVISVVNYNLQKNIIEKEMTKKYPFLII